MTSLKVLVFALVLELSCVHLCLFVCTCARVSASVVYLAEDREVIVEPGFFAALLLHNKFAKLLFHTAAHKLQVATGRDREE